MIKFEHTVIADSDQMNFIIEGMRNPMNSWDKSDSADCLRLDIDCHECKYVDKCPMDYSGASFIIGENDESLMKRLSKAGTDHRKFMRQMPVYVRITAPLYWWKEFDTYKVGTVSNSCSTMHKIQEKEFTLDDFSHEHLVDEEFGVNTLRCTSSIDILGVIVDALNFYRELYNMCPPELSVEKKDYWWQMIQLLPSSYNQTRNVSMNYEVLANIYKSRKAHKLDEWREFCKWIETLPYSWLITGKED